MPLVKIWRLAAALAYALSVVGGGGSFVGKQGIFGLMIAAIALNNTYNNGNYRLSFLCLTFLPHAKPIF